MNNKKVFGEREHNLQVCVHWQVLSCLVFMSNGDYREPDHTYMILRMWNGIAKADTDGRLSFTGRHISIREVVSWFPVGQLRFSAVRLCRGQRRRSASLNSVYCVKCCISPLDFRCLISLLTSLKKSCHKVCRVAMTTGSHALTCHQLQRNCILNSFQLRGFWFSGFLPSILMRLKPNIRWR